MTPGEELIPRERKATREDKVEQGDKARGMVLGMLYASGGGL